MIKEGEGQAIREVKAAEDLRCKGLVERRFDRLEALFDDELVHFHSTGVRHSKAELLQYLKEKLKFLSIERSGLDVRVFGEVALMTGQMTNDMQLIGGDEIVTAASNVSQLWKRSEGNWRLILFQATRSAA